jgi:uncharacterized membrane protein YphA (DoxX/SURF4 family)
VGWHFLYEGVAKLLTPHWSAVGYLDASRWIFAPLFHWIAGTPPVLNAVNFINVWALIFVGLALMLGAVVRAASLAGMALLLMYWLANPPITGLGLTVPAEGSYVIVDKNLVEFFGLALLAVLRAGKYFGLDKLIFRQKGEPPETVVAKPTSAAAPGPSASLAAGSAPPQMPAKAAESPVAPEPFAEPSLSPSRRELIASLAGVPFLGAFAAAVERKEKWNNYERKNLIEAVTAPSAKTLNVASLTDLHGTIPWGEINGRKFSRVILGGNLLCGNAHSRDLIYVDDLVKAYHTKDRIFATLLLAEKCGINTVLTSPVLCTMIDEYWKRNIGKIQFISDCFGLDYTKNPPQLIPFDKYLDKVRRAIDYGATACYIQGETADRFIQDKKLDLLVKTIDLIRQNKVLVGIGAHHIETVVACSGAGLEPDFWMKTLHHLNYWSAKNAEWHDNIFCPQPEETVAFMRKLNQPWIAFKVLAAGAITPEEGFRYALENGADFLCVGMYDFQMVKNVNTALALLHSNLPRERAWHGGPLWA